MTARALRLDQDGRLLDVALFGGARLRRLLAVLDADGDEARVVGGAVRNALLGRPVADVDIATTAEPAVVLARAEAAGLRVIPTGLAHGTVTVRVGSASFEVTTLRRDVETDGRHAVVRFSRDFAEDAERRDFTINALSAGADGTIFDTVGGLADLAAGRVRFIGDADQRIAEDHLRILRFFRFHAGYGVGPPDATGLAAATRCRASLRTLSRERVRSELLKLLVAETAPAVVRVMDEAGIASLCLGGAADAERLARLVAGEAALGPADALLRLAALGLHEAGDAMRLRQALRLSNDEARRLEGGLAARAALDPAAPPDHAACLALLFDHGAVAARDGMMLAAAEAPATARPGWVQALDIVATEPPPVLPIGGTEVIARGIAGGREVGAVLKSFQAAWVRAGFPRDPQRLARLLDQAIAERQA